MLQIVRLTTMRTAVRIEKSLLPQRQMPGGPFRANNQVLEAATQGISAIVAAAVSHYTIVDEDASNGLDNKLDSHSIRYRLLWAAYRGRALLFSFLLHVDQLFSAKPSVDWANLSTGIILDISYEPRGRR